MHIWRSRRWTKGESAFAGRRNEEVWLGTGSLSPTWRVEFAPRAERQLGRLAERDLTRILRFLNERIAVGDDPRRLGQALKGEPSGLWRTGLAISESSRKSRINA